MSLYFSHTQNILRFMNTEIYAENGLIHIQHRDRDTGKHVHKVVTVRTMLHRIAALNDAVAVIRKDRSNKIYADAINFEELQNAIDRAVSICQIAREQGTPNDPSAVRDKMRRKALTLQMGGTAKAKVSKNVF